MITFIQELLEDFRAASVWLRGLLVVTVVGAVFLIAMVAFALTNGDGEGARSSVQAEPTRAPTQEGAVAGATATALHATPPSADEERQPSTENREDCDVIRAEGYRSDVEHQWYLANCPEPGAEPVDAGPVDTGSDVGAPAPAATATPPPPPPTSAPTAPPLHHFDAADAIALFVSYFANAPDGHYDVSPASCSVTQASGVSWNVTCTGRPVGCDGPECAVGLSACVVEPTRSVIPGSC